MDSKELIAAADSNANAHACQLSIRGGTFGKGKIVMPPQNSQSMANSMLLSTKDGLWSKLFAPFPESRKNTCQLTSY